MAKHVHIALAHVDFSAVLVVARKQILIEAHAWVLLHLLLLHLLLGLVIAAHLLGLSLRWGLLTMATVTGATAHEPTDGLVTDLGASSESHTCSYGAHKTTAAEHATALLLGSSWVGPGWSLRGSGWGSR